MAKREFEFKVTDADKGKRLDKFLVDRMCGTHSRSFIQKLVAENKVLVDGLPAKSHHKVMSGESISGSIPEIVESFIEAEDIPIDIVYEDEHLMVVNKPADMVVHPAPGNRSGTLVNALVAHCRKLSGIAGALKPGVVHRIDKGTSGLLLVAKDDQTHAELARQFKAKTIKRLYIALAKGVVELDNGTIDLPIGRSRYDKKKMAVKFVQSKDAVTRYKVLERFADTTLLELTLGTGRTHQIRVHMTYIGHPLVGDTKYGTKSGIARPALHAKILGFLHPVTGKYMEFTSELPEDMIEVIRKARGAKYKGQKESEYGKDKNKAGKKNTGRNKAPRR